MVCIHGVCRVTGLKHNSVIIVFVVLFFFFWVCISAYKPDFVTCIQYISISRYSYFCIYLLLMIRCFTDYIVVKLLGRRWIVPGLLKSFGISNSASRNIWMFEYFLFPSNHSGALNSVISHFEEGKLQKCIACLHGPVKLSVSCRFSPPGWVKM